MIDEIQTSFVRRSSNKMPAGVKDALADCVSRHGGRTLEEAKEYVRRMERDGRIVEECWS
jgi:sulfite reductase alpha subunit-like flavoprotein